MTPCGPILFSVHLPQASAKFSYGRLITRGLTVIICFYPKIFFDHFSLRRLPLVNKMSEHALLVICPYDLNIVLDAWLIVTAWKLFSGSTSSYRLDFRRLPGPVFDPPRREGWVRAHFPEQRLVIEPTQAISVSICLRFRYFSDLWCEREVCLLAGEGCYSFDGEKGVCRFVCFVVILMDFKGAVSLAEFFFVYFVTKVC